MGKLFVCQNVDTTTAMSAIDGRTYTYASFMLGFTPASSVLWDFYGTPTGFNVQPESQLVGLDPLIAAPANANALLTSTGVYAREFGRCYIAGSYVGACAAAVNSDPYNAHAFPLTTYTRTLVISGSGILDGGTVSANGGPPPASLAPLSAAIVFR